MSLQGLIQPLAKVTQLGAPAYLRRQLCTAYNAPRVSSRVQQGHNKSEGKSQQARERAAFPWKRLGATLLIMGVLLAVMPLVDAPVFRWCKEIDRSSFGDTGVRGQEWAHMFRSGGYLWFWVLVAAAIFLVERAAMRRRSLVSMLRGPAAIIVAFLLAGLLAEVIKIAVHRKRPHGMGEYAFAPWNKVWVDTSNLAMPSSHAACAFAAATVMSRLFPAGWPVWYLFATGTAATRILQRDHFLSDCVVGAAVGIVSGLVVAHWLVRARAEREPTIVSVAAGST